MNQYKRNIFRGNRNIRKWSPMEYHHPCGMEPCDRSSDGIRKSSRHKQALKSIWSGGYGRNISLTHVTYRKERRTIMLELGKIIANEQDYFRYFPNIQETVNIYGHAMLQKWDAE